MRKLKLFFACLLMTVLSIGQMWGAEATIANTDNNGTCVWTDGTATITQVKWAGSTNVNNSYATNLRVYGGHVLLFDAGEGNTWTSFEYTVDTKYYGKSVSWGSSAAEITSSNYTSATAGTGSLVSTSGGSSTLGFTANRYAYIYNSATSSPVQLRITAFTATYEKSGGSTPPTPSKTLVSVAVSGTPTKTSYYVGDEFDPAGLTVTGHYSDNTDAPISSGITWAYDPSQTLSLNQTSIKVKATVSEITSTDWYVVENLIVAAAPAAVEYALFSGDIEEGDYVIYYDGKAMKNTIASNRFSYLSVAPANDKITNPDASIVWHIAQNNAYWTLYNESVNKYAGATGSNNQGKLVDANDATALWSISGSETYNIVNKSQSDNSKNAYLRNNGTYGFATYAQGTGGPLSLYKKVDDQVAVVKPAILGDTYFLTSSEVSMTCTTDGAEIRYTLDGTDPTATSALYENPFTLTETTTVKAIAVKGTDVSAIAEKEFTKATVKTVAEALAMSATDDVYVIGYISAITEVSTEHKNATYRISDDGTTTGEMIVYRGKYLNNADFTDANKDNIHVGDKVVVRGGLVEYQNAMQLATGNYLISIEYPEVAIPTFEPAVESFLESIEVTLACSTDGAEIRYTLDGTDPTATSTLYEDPFTLTETKTVKAIAIKGGTTTNVVSKTYTKQEVMTVAEALASSAATGVYVKGIISTITEVSTSFKNATYRISDNGTKTDEMIVYRGRYINNTDFTSEGQIELGDEVVVYGNLVEYQNAMQLATGNYLISLVRKANAALAWSAESVELTVGDEFTAPTLSNPNNLTVTIASDNTELATVENGVVSLVENATGTAKISATFAGNDQYKAASVTYSITVNASETPVDTRKVANSPATFTTTSGDLDPADIAFAAYKGGAGTAPANYNNGIRLYQAPSESAIGGYITLAAVAGCTIDEVQITTTGTYATTVTYSVDGNETLLKSESVAKSGSYTTGTGLNVQSVNIVNKGTTSSGRLEIASIKVYYTGDALTIDHYELGGTYATEFEVGDEFNHTGLIVYAAYDALGENKIDITSACTFSTPDMSAEGEQTIEISYKDAVVKSYTITVNASTDTRKVAESPATFTAVSGDMNPADITFAAKQGGAGNVPYLATTGIRLYQIGGSNTYGGYITLKAAQGCTIDQVMITTSNSYATTVAYSVDGNENLLGSEEVAKSSSYTTPDGLNVQSVNILNLGTGSNGRLEIASIKVWYTGDAMPIDHYFLSGTYQTEFVENSTFNYDGLEVYAAYDAQETIVEAVEGFTVVADLSNVGQTTASVQLNSAEIATYNITVIAQTKLDPALAYDPESDVIAATAIASWVAPTLSNTYNVAVSYSSNKESVAKVDEQGNITLEGGYGTAVITASFAGDDDYLSSEATYTITVNEPAEDLSGTWKRVTAVAVGQKIIIAGTYNSKTMAMGKQNSNNRAAVLSSLDEDVLTPGAATKVFTLVDAGEGLFAIQASNGKYLNAAGTGSSNYLREADDFEAASAKWTITFDENGANIVATSTDNRNVIRYNSTNNSELFSCYAAGGQRAINIYSNSEVVRSGLTAGNYYTVCYNKTMTDIQGASLWSFAGKDAGKAFIVEAEAPYVAGTPYLIYAESAALVAVTEEVANPSAGNHNGLYGTLSYMDADALATAGATHMLKNNEIRPLGANNHLDANRAYIILNEITDGTPALAPGRRVRAIPMQESTATDLEGLEATDAPVKMIINGQIFIIRGEKMYNANGQLVK